MAIESEQHKRAIKACDESKCCMLTSRQVLKVQQFSLVVLALSPKDEDALVSKIVAYVQLAQYEAALSFIAKHDQALGDKVLFEKVCIYDACMGASHIQVFSHACAGLQLIPLWEDRGGVKRAFFTNLTTMQDCISPSLILPLLHRPLRSHSLGSPPIPKPASSLWLSCITVWAKVRRP